MARRANALPVVGGWTLAGKDKSFGFAKRAKELKKKKKREEKAERKRLAAEARAAGLAPPEPELEMIEPPDIDD